MMFALVAIRWWHWLAFIACVVIFITLDLRLFHRRAHVVKFREAFLWTAIWFCLAMLFALGLKPMRGQREALEFLTGYIIELSLSMDNVFVIALIFTYFRIPSEFQHRVLYWGILGALIMRGVMIGAGVALIMLVDWILYAFGLLLLFSGIKMLFVDTDVDPEKNRVVRLARMLYPVSPNLDGQKFITTFQGRQALTPLALVLLMVETTDLFFAVDSIPAVFAVTTKPFIVFTSNVFAILGLRSLYFVLAGLIGYFRYLKYGLALVLVFTGIKMLLDPHDETPKWFQIDIPTSISLLIVGAIILSSIFASVFSRRKNDKAKTGDEEKPDAADKEPKDAKHDRAKPASEERGTAADKEPKQDQGPKS